MNWYIPRAVCVEGNWGLLFWCQPGTQNLERKVGWFCNSQRCRYSVERMREKRKEGGEWAPFIPCVRNEMLQRGKGWEFRVWSALRWGGWVLKSMVDSCSHTQLRFMLHDGMENTAWTGNSTILQPHQALKGVDLVITFLCWDLLRWGSAGTTPRSGSMSRATQAPERTVLFNVASKSQTSFLAP